MPRAISEPAAKLIGGRWHPPFSEIGAAWMEGFLCGLKEAGLLNTEQLVQLLKEVKRRTHE